MDRKTPLHPNLGKKPCTLYKATDLTNGDNSVDQCSLDVVGLLRTEGSNFDVHKAVEQLGVEKFARAGVAEGLNGLCYVCHGEGGGFIYFGVVGACICVCVCVGGGDEWWVSGLKCNVTHEVQRWLDRGGWIVVVGVFNV